MTLLVRNISSGETNLKFVLALTLYSHTGEVKNSEHFCYAEETKLALEQGKLSADITEEQRKLTEADLVIFQVEP